MNYRKRAQCKVAGSFCPWNSCGVRAKVSTKWAASLAKIPVLALGTALVEVHLLRLGKVRATCIDNIAIIIFFTDKVLEIIFNAGQFYRGQELTIGKIGKTIFISTDARKLFYITIPWCNILVANGPVNCKAVACRPFKIKIAPSLCLSCPQ